MNQFGHCYGRYGDDQHDAQQQAWPPEQARGVALRLTVILEANAEIRSDGGLPLVNRAAVDLV